MTSDNKEISLANTLGGPGPSESLGFKAFHVAENIGASIAKRWVAVSAEVKYYMCLDDASSPFTPEQIKYLEDRGYLGKPPTSQIE